MNRKNGGKKYSPLPVLNGYSICSLEIDQEGNLTVTFDLPVRQESKHYEIIRQASRTFDVYQCPELERHVRALFRAVRRRLLRQPDPDMAEADCEKCRDAPCCRKYNVLLTDEDIDRLRGRLSRRAFIARYTDPAVDWSGDYRYQLKSDSDEVGEKCIFLKRDRKGRMRCSVYEKRPAICRNFDVAVCPDFTPLKEDRKPSAKPVS